MIEVDAALLNGTRLLFEDLHRHPELSWEEHETAARLRAFLEARGLPVTGAAVEPGLVVDIDGGRPGRRLFVRADLDALPIQEETGLAYTSAVPGVMHACGHDLHAATLAAVATVLWNRRLALAGSFRLVFQPSEEQEPSGARALVKAGLAEGHGAFVALHVDPHLEAGRLRFRPGAMNAAVDTFRITLRGRGGHSSRPHLCIDPIRIGALLVSHLHQLPGQVQPVHEPAVLAVTVFTAGDAFNIIPGDAHLQGSLRTSSPASRRALIDALRSTTEHVARAHGATAEIEVQEGHPPVLNDEELTEVARHAIADALGPEVFCEMPRASMGGDDFSEYGVKGPQLLMRLGIHTPGEPREDLHSPRFKVDPRALPVAIEALAAVAIRLAAT